jgi:S1-C subfamily serine protease
VSCDDDADEDAPDFRRPPHPDDRIWRHPSEMDEHPIAPIGLPVHRVRAVRRAAAGWPWWRVAATGALGVVVVLGGLAVVFLTDTGGGNEAGVLPGSSSRPSDAAGRADTAADAVAPSVVRLEGGSGVLIRDDGLVLTSATLIDGAGPVPVWLPDGTAVEATVVGVDGVTSIAVLDLPGEGHRPADLVPLGTDLTGAAYSVCAVCPDGSGGAAATAGVVGTARKLNGQGAAGLDGVVEVEGRADPSALGGPVVDGDGTVLGITTAIGSDRSSYFTPIDVGQKVAGDLLDSGVIHRSWLGIEGMDRVEGSGLHASGGYGAEVVTVATGSPAEAAGVQAGDVIVSLDGRPIDRMPDLIRWLQSLSPGDRVEVTVERSGERLTLGATLSERD